MNSDLDFKTLQDDMASFAPEVKVEVLVVLEFRSFYTKRK